MKNSLKNRLFCLVTALCIVISATPTVFAANEDVTPEAQKEVIGRGAIGAVNPDGGIYLSWRLLENEPADTVSFNIYKNGSVLTSITNTNYIDEKGTKADVYNITSVINGIEGEKSPNIAILDGHADAGYESAPYAYFDIPVNIPTDTSGKYGKNNESEWHATYNSEKTDGGESGGPNDVSVGDVDGDGIYEIILKWDPSNSKDNSQGGVTGNVYIDCYEYDGTQLWRIDLGRNIRAGAHYTQFQVYDYDGDGKAEVAMRTAPGSIDGTGSYVTQAGVNDRIKNANNSKEYVNTTGSGNTLGQVITNPEYLTVFNGETGAAMQTIEYEPARGSAEAWGKDAYGGRSERFLAGTAYLDGVHPSMIFARGYYQRSSVAAYDWDGKNLTNRWLIDSGMNSGHPFYGQGNHNLSVADLDNDGKDEIVYGSAALDDDGSVLHSMGWGHGDALHVSDFDNDGNQEIFAPLEETGNWGIGFREGNGTEIWHYVASDDDGRGAMAYFSRKYGVLAWDGAFGIRTIDGTLINNNPRQDNNWSNANFPIYWDGDLCSEHFDGNRISKFNDDTASFGRFLNFPGVTYNNTTKKNPCLQADLFGDWREELILRKGDNSGLRVFMSLCPSDYMFSTLLQDHQYRMAIAWQNTGYNQPPHQSYYIGYDKDAAKTMVTVKDSGGNPLSGATVTMSGPNERYGTTGADGTVTLRAENGEYNITVECDGYTGAEKALTVGGAGQIEFLLEKEKKIGETWDFNSLQASEQFADGDKITGDKGGTISVKYGTSSVSGALPPKAEQKSDGDNFLHFTDKGNGQDGWSYAPENPIDLDRLVIELDFKAGETGSGIQLLRVLDKNNVPGSLAYSGTDGRVFDIISGNGNLTFTDYLSKGKDEKTAKSAAITGFKFSAGTWYTLKLVYTRNKNSVAVYTKNAAEDTYTLRDTFVLGSASPKGDVPMLSPTMILTNTRGSDATDLSVDNLFIGTTGGAPARNEKYTINSQSKANGILTVNITKNSDQGGAKDILIAAAYDKESGVLTENNTKEIEMTANETKDITIELPAKETDEISVYIWNNMNEITPLVPKCK